MPFDPALPQANSLVSSAELRAQLNGLYDIAQDKASFTDLNDAIQTTALTPEAVALLSQSISNPPTQAQVQAIQNKLNELITALKRPQV